MTDISLNITCFLFDCFSFENIKSVAMSRQNLKTNLENL